MLEQSSIVVRNVGKEEPPSLDVTLPEEIGIGLVGGSQPVLGLLFADLAVPTSLQDPRHAYWLINFIEPCKFRD